jgi:hypothetical protein
MDKCKKCGESGGLIMSIKLVDEICEYCGEWQDGIYNDVYARIT